LGYLTDAEKALMRVLDSLDARLTALEQWKERGAQNEDGKAILLVQDEQPEVYVVMCPECDRLHAPRTPCGEGSLEMPDWMRQVRGR
jgi:hypothetical protein